MNKTNFTKELTNIIKTSRVGKPLNGEPLRFVLDACLKSNLYKTKASRDEVQVIPRMRKLGKIRQKFLMLVEDNKELAIFKGKLIESLYPKKTKVNPEREHRTKVLASMRSLIEPQILAYREGQKKKIATLVKLGEREKARELNKCKLTGQPLTTCRVAVDHITPFIQLVDQWLELNELTFSDIKLKGRGNIKSFTSTKLANSWVDYHLDKASLQLTCSKANSRAGSKGYSTSKSV